MLGRNKLVLPAWTFNLPDRTRITAKEISKFFGYKSEVQMHTLLKRGQFPKHEHKTVKAFKFGRTSSHYWSLGVIREYVIKQNNDGE
jgi:hypothetical protein